MRALNSKEWFCICILTGILLLTAIHYWPKQERVRVYSGPGIAGNLFNLEIAKERWELDHAGSSAWPTWQDIAPYFSPTNFHITPVYGEIYLINKAGAPVFAYFPKTEWGFHEGQTTSLDEQDMQEVKKFVPQGFVDRRPNKSPEPTGVGAGSSASRSTSSVAGGSALGR